MNNYITTLNNLDEPILEYLKTHAAIKREDYLKQVLPARLSIIEKLLNALVREGLIQPDSITFRARLLIIRLNNSTILCPVETGCGFERFTLQDFPVLWTRTDNTMSPILSPESLLDECLEKQTEYTNFDRFREELKESAANMALSLAMIQFSKQPLLRAGTYENIAACFDSSEWGPQAYTCSEQLYANGHPLHPSAKIRTGFSLDDIFRYSPESASPVTIRWILLHHSLLRTAATGDAFSAPALMSHVFPEAWAVFATRHHQQLQDYIAVPVHEWQYNHHLENIYREEISNGLLLLLPEDAFNTTGSPTISVRTLIVNGASAAQHGQLKASLQIQLTGYKRTITPQTVLNGPVVSRCIQEIMQRETTFFSRYPAAFLQEHCGGCFHHTSRDKATNLSYLWREDAATQLQAGQHIVVSAFLIATSPLASHSVMQDYILHYAVQQQLPITAAPLRWWHDYLECVLSPVLLMLTRYGIGMEAHGQNVLVVFEKGRPVKAIYRDWGGLRIYHPRLEQHGLSLSMEPESVTIVTNLDASRSKLVHAALQVHIGEMVRILSIENKIAPDLLWEAAFNTIHTTYSYIAKQYPELLADIAADMAALTTPTVSCKSMVLMQLMGARKETYFSCANPLHPFHNTSVRTASYTMAAG